MRDKSFEPLLVRGLKSHMFAKRSHSLPGVFDSAMFFSSTALNKKLIFLNIL